ncbi:hypothetical protein OROGR_004701 [Orobanche gracilis]
METIAAFRASFSSLSPCSEADRSGPGRSDLRVGSRTFLPNSRIQRRHSMSPMKFVNRKVAVLSRKRTGIRASMQPSDSASSAAPIAPLQLESPIGQFLSQILISHPHLVPAAVEQQLEQLQTDRDSEKEKEEPSASGTELVLYSADKFCDPKADSFYETDGVTTCFFAEKSAWRKKESMRIAEVKANERKKVLEEILYALIVQKFMDANVPLVPTITPSPPNNSGRVDIWPSQEDKNLECLHSPEAYEMIQNHLALILGNRTSDSDSLAQISKLRAGQVYAASIMYGYFLKRVDRRFQLEKAMKILPQDTNNEESHNEQVMMDVANESLRNAQTLPEVSSWSDGGGFAGIKPSRLRTYVMSFDGETLRRHVTVGSKEAISIVEKHTEALFGRPEIAITREGTIDSSKDEVIKISFGGLRRLVLEAVTFGSFLWDVESYVDSRYHFVAN